MTTIFTHTQKIADKKSLYFHVVAMYCIPNASSYQTVLWLPVAFHCVTIICIWRDGQSVTGMLAWGTTCTIHNNNVMWSFIAILKLLAYSPFLSCSSTCGQEVLILLQSLATKLTIHQSPNSCILCYSLF